MAVFITLPLFSKPGVELGEGEEVTGEQLRQLGTDLALRLDMAAGMLDRLTAAGWQAGMTLYDVSLSHPFLHTEAEARSQLDGLGIDPDQLCLDEFEDEEEFEEEEGEEA
jgi:hypothetical protein